ncbi:hypothetical protein EAF00_011685 [Botryotinia globosa]|nr:hypothetical protein EAF00_011685 [Botryotinia globosa]
MSRQIITNHNSRPASTYQPVNQQSRTSYSRASNNESLTGVSDLYRSPNDYGRVRESRNVFGKYLSSRGQQERRENKEFANFLRENDRVFAECRRKELEDRHRDEEARQRERLERMQEEKDKVQGERRTQDIKRTGGWYQHDLEREEEKRTQREISRTIAASPPKQRLQKGRRMPKRTKKERIQRDKSRKEERVQQLNTLKREDRIQEGEILRENYRSREGSRPSIPLPRQRPAGPQLHRLAPSPPPSQSTQPPRLPRTPQPHQTPQTPLRRPAPSPSYNTNTLPRNKIEHNSPPTSSLPPRRSRQHHNPDPPEPRSLSRDRSDPPASMHSLTKPNITQHNENRHSFLNHNPAATKDSRSKHNENRHSSINNTTAAKQQSNPKPKDKKLISRTSRIKTSGKARVKDCVQAGAVVGRVGADVGIVLWSLVTAALEISY